MIESSVPSEGVFYNKVFSKITFAEVILVRLEENGRVVLKIGKTHGFIQ